ncbi:PREDICTED: uncharacterized protein LOC104590549 [Nelumbo nucifera]|uniref:Uncharacterized protein LOC104590549 n=1 Tax=Nelumbo nucifera TaxID=4432 RepID=A0A1U7Z5H9_NELNU|nr:PREDICTED: uncharacterized protein LOC104590549 [Nelumbo nucifera]
MAIGGRGKLGYVTRDKRTSKEDISHPKWVQEIYLVMTWLCNSILPHISQNYLWTKTAKEIWDSMKETYSQPLNVARAYELKCEVKNLKQRERPVSVYFATLKSLWHEIDHLETIEWESQKDAATYIKLIETNRVFEFLAGLNSDFDITRQQLLTRESVILSQTYSLVHSEESRRKVMLSFQPTKAALAVAKFMAGGEKEKEVKKEDKRDSFCDHCKKPKHTRDTCWKLHPHLMPARLRNKKGSANTATTTDSTSSSSTRTTSLDALAAVRAALTQLEKEAGIFGSTSQSSATTPSQPNSALAHTSTRATACHASVPEEGKKVYLLKKALYGLKQSPRAWFDRFILALNKFGYIQAQSDHTLFFKKTGHSLTLLTVYAVDIVVTGNDIGEIETLKQHFTRNLK